MRRSVVQLAALIHYRRVHIAVALGAAVATAVLTGALVAGDSVRGSLRDLTLERLGRIEHAVVSGRFFRQELAAALPAGTAPILLLPSAAAHAGSGARAGKVQVVGADARFAALFPGASPEALAVASFLDDTEAPASPFPTVLLNQTLADELSASPGDAVLLSLQRSGEAHPEALFGRRGSEDVLHTLRCEVAGVIPARGPGRFALDAHQAEPRTVFVPLDRLQRALDLAGRSNALLVGLPDDGGTTDPGDHRGRLDAALQLADLDLDLRRRGDHLALESHRFVLDHVLGERVLETAAALGLPRLAVSTYLANRIDIRDRSLPYSTIAALDAVPEGGWGIQAPAGDELLLNKWAADDLLALTGDAAVLHYYEVGPREELIEREAAFTVSAAVTMAGLGADRGLTPAYPGIQEARDMSAWSAPFPVDLNRIRPRDEDYWDRYGAAPKAFVSGATGRRLWSSRFGELTSVRLRAAEGQDLESTAQRFADALLKAVGSRQAGLQVRPVRATGLSASSGATDFGGLFIGFSLFLITSAAVLVGLLFRLGVEQRAPEVGLLLATGFPLRAVRRRLLTEALVVAAAGCLLGVAGAAAYGGLMMAGLRSWWVAAVGTSALRLHLSAPSLATGFALSLGVVALAMGLTLRRLGRTPVRALLAGVVEATMRGAGRTSRVLAPASLVAAVVLIAVTGSVATPATRAGVFFGAGALLLVAGLAGVSLWLHRIRAAPSGSHPLASVAAAGARNSARHPGRSLTAICLVASACFVIVAVGAQRRSGGLEDAPGAGGFALAAEADVPVHGDLNDPGVRLDLGVPAAVSGLLGSGRIFQLRSLPGEDVSCLNLYQPGRPRLLGVPPELVRRGGFPFASHQPLDQGMSGNPWRLLEQDLGPDVVPAVADVNSAQWILHLGLGDELTLDDHAGRPVRLRLVGLLARSIFQSELLIGEDAFERLFPDRTGYGFFLIEAPAQPRELIVELERGLRDYGFDATTAADRLARFLEVENTYLSTFQTLGGLGLLLGTLGLALLLLRNAFERRRELAALQAFGFRRQRLSALLFWETALLLLTGVAVGTVAALVAAAPHLGAEVPWRSLALTLALVVTTGWLANAGAVRLALRRPLLPALKSE